MKIVIETIPHKEQRYPTVGDYFYKLEPIMTSSAGPSESFEQIGLEEVLYIKVSALSDWRRQMLVAVHELVEALTCKNNGIEEPDIAAFDMAYESKRLPGDNSEPGDDPQAPYVNQHCLATGIEMILAQQWGVKWAEYGKEINSLP